MTSPAGDLSGRRLGRYRVDARLGEGGMGVVYRAHDAQLQRKVALKVLSEPDTGGRLLQEARAASALSHPYICTVYEIGDDAETPFIAMEFVEGETLARLLRTGPLPPERVLRYALLITEALAHAHSRGVIHRDLKCANVMVTPDDHIKILDFGLAARMPSPDVHTATAATAVDTGSGISGTLAYMAPEALRGEPADERSEIWSVGVMLYELLSGRLPFSGTSVFALVAAAISERPAPLPATTPRPLQATVEHCLDKERGRRYQSARELRAALEAVETRRSRSGVRPASVGRAAAIPRQRRIESIVVLPLANRCAEPDQDFFVDGMTDALIGELARVQTLRVISRTSAMRYRDTDKTLPQIAEELGVDAVIEGSVARSGSTVRVQVQMSDAVLDRTLWSGTYDRGADDVLALQTDVAQAIVGEIRARVAAPEKPRQAKQAKVNEQAHALYLKGLYHINKTVWTPADYEQALEHFRQASEIAPTWAPAYVGMARIYHRLGGYGFWRPKDAFSLGKTAALKAVELDSRLGEAHAAVGFSRFLYDWDFAASEQAYRTALALKPDYESHLQLGACLSAQARHAEAVAHFQQAIAVNPFSSDARWGFGMIYRHGGWHDRSIETLETWLQLEPNDIQARFQLALTRSDQGQYDDAAALLEAIAAIPPLRVIALGPLGYVYGRQGRTADGEKCLAELETLAGLTRVAPGWIAQVHMGLGRPEQALDWLEKAVDYHDTWNLVFVHLERRWEPLRGHPRFQALLERTHHV